MARIARVVVPGLPHHVTQRGVRSVNIFTGDADRELYLSLVAEHAGRRGVTFLAWCLMTNHVHFICVPKREDSLARCFGEAHKRYTRERNFREGVRGWLFQGRFGSYPVQRDGHLMAAGRYVELNPVRAGIVKRADEWEWSSARYHLGRRSSDALAADRDLLGLADDWAEFLREGVGDAEARQIQKRLSTGRPWGTVRFLERLEKRLKRDLVPGRPGPPKGRPRRR